MASRRDAFPNRAIKASQAEGDYVRIELFPLSAFKQLGDLKLRDNGKLHDLDLIYKLIEEYGFQDPPKWDGTLNSGAGGFSYGNGRTESLIRGLYQARLEGREPPRGIPKHRTTGEWLVPVKVGVDCLTESQAIAFSVDHNNAGVAPFLDVSGFWDEGYSRRLQELALQGTPVFTVPLDVANDLALAAQAVGQRAEERFSVGLSGGDRLEVVSPLAPATQQTVTHPQLPDTRSVQPGDVWALGLHRLHVAAASSPKSISQVTAIIGYWEGLTGEQAQIVVGGEVGGEIGAEVAIDPDQPLQLPGEAFTSDVLDIF